MSRTNEFSWTTIPGDDPDWVAELILQFKRVYFVLVRSREVPPLVAYNCVAETLMDLLKSWHPSGPPSHITNLFTYVLQATNHTYIRTRIPRKDARLLNFIAANEVTSLEPADNANHLAPEQAIQREEFTRAEQKMFALPPIMVRVLILSCSGWTPTEIASTLGISKSYARSLRHKAIQKLRKQLSA
jgi:RNA polymerase sigma factor (sigma-70 family)